MKAETKKILCQKIRKLCEDKGKTPVFIGIDGHCGAGKTTLGMYLHEQMGGNLFHMDDFFLRPEQRTESREKEPGGNIDYERFRTEVLDRIRNENPVLYRKYNCRKRCLEAGRMIAAEKLNIIEGAYCMHPYFEDPYDLKIFLDIEQEAQILAIRERNGEEMVKQFREQWIPMENLYFSAFSVKEQCDIVLVKSKAGFTQI